MKAKDILGSAIGSAIVTFLVFLISQGFGKSLLNWQYLVIWLLVLGAIVTSIFFIRKDVPKYGPVNHNFEVGKKSAKMIIKDDGKLTYIKTKELISKINGARSYEDKFHWTGIGQLGIESGKEDHSVEFVQPNGVWQVYRTNFNRSLKKGDKIDIETVWKLSEDTKRMNPFINQSIEEPTSDLELIVQFCEARKPIKVYFETSQNFASHDPFDVRDATDMGTIADGMIEYRWAIPEPSLLYCYQIRWVET